MSQQQQQQYHLPPGAMPPNIDPNAAAISAQHHNQMVQNFWQNTLHQMEHMEIDFKNHPLPLARIKKVMKSDGDVKMISSEAPLIFSKACEIFIAELTLRSWMVAEENKRRTLQRTDIAQAISKSDQYDFLIDIVPREELAYKKFKMEMNMMDPNAAYMMGLPQFVPGPPPGMPVDPNHPGYQQHIPQPYFQHQQSSSTSSDPSQTPQQHQQHHHQQMPTTIAGSTSSTSTPDPTNIQPHPQAHPQSQIGTPHHQQQFYQAHPLSLPNQFSGSPSNLAALNSMSPNMAVGRSPGGKGPKVQEINRSPENDGE